MNKNCNYIIKLSDGTEYTVPSLLIEENERSLPDLKTSLKRWILSEENYEEIIDKIESSKKNIIVPADLEGSIVGQFSLNSTKRLFGDAKLNVQLGHLKKVLKREKSNADKKNTKDLINIDKENIAVVYMPSEIKYQYLPEQDVLLINKNSIDKSEIMLRGILEMIVSKRFPNIENPKLALMSLNPEVLSYLNIGGNMEFSIADLEKLYYDAIPLKEVDIFSELSNNRANWKTTLMEIAPLVNSEEIDKNFSREEYLPIESLKSGDLILKTSKDKVYTEIFLDYSINAEGNYLVNFISPNASFPGSFETKRSTIKARLHSPDNKFENYEITPTPDIHPIDITGDEGMDFIFKYLKRGDKIAFRTSTKAKKDTIYTIANIKGSNISFVESNEDIKIKGSLLKGVLLNANYHPEIVKDINLTDYIEYEGPFRNSLIKKGDLVSNIEDGSVNLLVLDNFDDTIVVKSLFTNQIITINGDSVTSLFIDMSKITPLLNDLEENKKHILLTAEQSMNLGANMAVDNTEYSVIEAYNSFKYEVGDFIIQNGIPHVVTSVNKNIVQFTDGSTDPILFLTSSSANLEGSIIVTKRFQNTKFEENSIKRNNFAVGTSKKEDMHSIEVAVFSDNGRMIVKDIKDDLTAYQQYENITNTFKEDPSQPLYGYRYKNKTNGVWERDLKGLIQIEPINFESVFDYLVPGSFIKLDTFQYWQIEKRIGDKLLISYSYYRSEIVGDKKVRTGKKNVIKKLISSAEENVKWVYVPTFAKNAIDKIKGVQTSLNLTHLDATDSPEILVSMAELLQDKYGIKINFVHTSELESFGADVKSMKGLRAFVLDGQYYVNIDNASIADPLHEFMHVILGSMKYSNQERYEDLVYSVRNHPMFEAVSKIYQEVTLDQLEETFIKLFTETVRKRILVEGVFTEEVFDEALKNAVTEMFDLKDSLEGTSSFELLDSQVRNILVDFNSSLIQNTTSFYNQDHAVSMIAVSSVLRQLIKDEKLKEMCNE